MMSDQADEKWISAKATALISLELPQEAQLNAIAQFLGLIAIQVEASLSSPDQHLSAQEVEQKAKIKAIWEWVKQMRAKEAEVLASISDGNAPDRSSIEWPNFPT